MPTTPASPTELTQEKKEELAKGLIGGLRELVTGGPGLFENRPAFIAGEGPTDPLSNAVRAVSQFNCRAWAAGDKSNYSIPVNNGNAELCNPYLEDIGELPPDGGVSQPFTGGQCEGVLYDVVGTFTSKALGGECNTTQSWAATVHGPVGRVFRENSVFWRLGGGPPSNGSNLFKSPGGSILTIGGDDCANSPATGGTNAVGVSIGSVTRRDGNPDNCGDPNPDYTPPDTVTPVTPLPPDITVQIPGVGPVTVTVSIGDDGKPTVCIVELDYCTTIDVGGDEPTPGPPPLEPGDQGEPGSPEGTGVAGEAEGEAPEGSVLVGLLMSLVSAPESPNEYAPGVYRGAAYVYMGGTAGLDQDFAGSMLSDGQFIFAETENLTRWRVRANSGYDWDVTPYYREVEP